MNSEGLRVFDRWETHRFELLFVEFAAVQEVRVDAVSRPGRLDGCRRHVHEVLGREAGRRVNTGCSNKTIPRYSEFNSPSAQLLDE